MQSSKHQVESEGKIYINDIVYLAHASTYM